MKIKFAFLMCIMMLTFSPVWADIINLTDEEIAERTEMVNQATQQARQKNRDTGLYRSRAGLMWSDKMLRKYCADSMRGNISEAAKTIECLPAEKKSNSVIEKPKSESAVPAEKIKLSPEEQKRFDKEADYAIQKEMDFRAEQAKMSECEDKPGHQWSTKLNKCQTPDELKETIPAGMGAQMGKSKKGSVPGGAANFGNSDAAATEAARKKCFASGDDKYFVPIPNPGVCTACDISKGTHPNTDRNACTVVFSDAELKAAAKKCQTGQIFSGGIGCHSCADNFKPDSDKTKCILDDKAQTISATSAESKAPVKNNANDNHIVREQQCATAGGEYRKTLNGTEVTEIGCFCSDGKKISGNEKCGQADQAQVSGNADTPASIPEPKPDPVVSNTDTKTSDSGNADEVASTPETASNENSDETPITPVPESSTPVSETPITSVSESTEPTPEEQSAIAEYKSAIAAAKQKFEAAVAKIMNGD